MPVAQRPELPHHPQADCDAHVRQSVKRAQGAAGHWLVCQAHAVPEQLPLEAPVDCPRRQLPELAHHPQVDIAVQAAQFVAVGHGSHVPQSAVQLAQVSPEPHTPSPQRPASRTSAGVSRGTSTATSTAVSRGASITVTSITSSAGTSTFAPSSEASTIAGPSVTAGESVTVGASVTTGASVSTGASVTAGVSAGEASTSMRVSSHAVSREAHAGASAVVRSRSVKDAERTWATNLRALDSTPRRSA